MTLSTANEIAARSSRVEFAPCGDQGCPLSLGAPQADSRGPLCSVVRKDLRRDGSVMTDDLLELEERGWQALSSPDPVRFCEEWLADDALMIVPGMIVDRRTFLHAIAHEPPWVSHRIEAPRTVQLTVDSVALIYRVAAERNGQPEYVALLTSVYANREGRWQLVLHQQTPMP